MGSVFKAICILVATVSIVEASWPAPEMRVVGSNERLPLAMTQVDASISGVVADVRLSQRYENRGDSVIEAIYVFPVRRNAAVYEMQLKIGDRQVRSVLEKKEDAQQRYQEAVSEGRTASLLEQRDADVLSLSIGNILPGDDIEVTLSYSELLVPEAGRYRFFFPNTFGDVRAADEVDDPSALRLTGEDAAIEYALDVQVQLDAPVPIAAVESPSHEILIFDDSTPYSKVIQLSDEDVRAAERDFVLDFRLQGDEIETGILAHEENGEGYFLLMAQPPAQISQGDIVPREYLFVVDVSGSMNGAPIETVKDLMEELIISLRPNERFNVLLFESAVSALTLEQSLLATEDNLVRALQVFDQNMGYGGTRLVQALEAAYDLPASPGYSRTLVVITDGHIQAGAEVSALINANLDQGNVFAMGIGTHVSQQTIERIARAGRGEPVFVDTNERAAPQARRLLTMIESPLLTDVRLEFDGVNAFELEPSVIPDVFAERPVIVTGRYVPGTGGRAILSGRSAGREQVYELGFTAQASRNPAIKRLWARERLTSWMDGRIDGRLPRDVEGRVEEIVEHSLEYQVLSPWTAFVAVDEVVRTDGQAERVEQPAPRRAEPRSGGLGFTPLPTVIQLAPVLASLHPGAVDQGPERIFKSIDEPDGRLVLVLGEVDEFLDHASRYWINQWSASHVVGNIHSYAQLLDVLERHPNRGNGPWKELVIISHASEWKGLSLPVFLGGEIASPLALSSSIETGRLDPLGIEVIDGESRIRIEGCGVGRRADLLESIARLFGPQTLANIYAYPGLVAYSEGADGRLFREDVPYISSIVQSNLAIESKVDELTKIMTREYGVMGWGQWMHKLYPVNVEMVLEGSATGYRDADRLARTHSPVRQQLAELGLDVSSLDWAITPGNHREPSRLVGTGYIVVVRPELQFED